MIEPIPERLERALSRTLAPSEQVFIKLRGAFKEALVCTSMRIIILKAGWMTGQLFGTGMFQCPYANLEGAQVNYRLLTGYFEISTGGMQSTPKSFWNNNQGVRAAKSYEGAISLMVARFWNNDQGVSAAKAPNCVTISGPRRAEMFRDACTFIMERASRASYSGNYR